MSTRVPRSRLLVAQCGGPTAVVNASLAGVVDAAEGTVLGVRQGIRGLVNDWTTPLLPEDTSTWRAEPAAHLESGRFRLDDRHWRAALETCRAHRADRLVLIGGNGTMYVAAQLQRLAHEAYPELRVVGVPKTVDNDLQGTDWTPGFPSAARFLALAVRDIGLDLASMANFEQVRIVETMGRNVGWLARSTALFRDDPDTAPHLIYTPEMAVPTESIVAAIDETYRRVGHALVVVSEGLVPRDTHQHLNEPLIGGVALTLARIVGSELGIAARGEVLGTLQRAASFATSSQDRRLAYELGQAAAGHVDRGDGGLMVRIEGSGTSDVRVGTIALEAVAGHERPLPAEWVATPDDPCEPFQQWLRPLIDAEPGEPSD
ncbi:diphosphate--fructose-6-phosphate 1-phosphotransferase [Actinobacteria bacterium YIM 96077]|uniref:Phosphofructokinase domain-containing protein n=1 Tax=Phytoactinopolyspora halophila TaxID=1981511 RepID=A0A329QZU9_9ACTN|nr:diphosphate--fructose-6-phosphate 1-phosphotransferase [Phytoactinopolyspora halophila]AYY11712.1 diphosphate--fructose-6-phosphate 1-phosphotransferase [Actinobacteria bacterium YIM 96077]RAW17855.1 hypothetical protein DPM12_03105 [Phytoactinopolyspora halophila]